MARLSHEPWTRFRLEARPRFRRRACLVAAPALVLLALAAPVRGQNPALPDLDRPGPGPLPWRVGGRVGFTIDAATTPDTSGLGLDLYVRIPPATLATLVRDRTGRDLMRLNVRLRGGYGARQANATQDFPIVPGDSAGGYGKVIVMHFPVRPGPHKLDVRLEDLNSRKRGLAYVGRKVPESGAVSGEIEVPAPQAGRDLSDFEFAWTESASTSNPSFLRAGRTVIPNPERLYGLFAKELRVFFTARSVPGDERAWRWVARILDGQGRARVERESTGVAGRTLEASLTTDLSSLPAGGYALELKAWQEGDAGALIRRASFGIAWEPGSWLRNPRDVEDEVHFLLEPEAEESFARLHPGEQEAYLEAFWRIRDPDPDTPVNEAREIFLRRIEIANRTYASFGVGRGMFSDMGRVFIRYGEPSEVLHQVIPAGDHTLLEAIAELQTSEDRDVGEVRQKGLGGDMRPFEVWIYDGEIPLPPDADPNVARNLRRKRLVFLFVDEHGHGNYTLRYSTE